MNHKSSVIYCENSYISMTGMYFDSNTCGHGCAIFSKTCQIIITNVLIIGYINQSTFIVN